MTLNILNRGEQTSSYFEITKAFPIWEITTAGIALLGIMAINTANLNNDSWIEVEKADILKKISTVLTSGGKETHSYNIDNVEIDWTSIIIKNNTDNFSYECENVFVIENARWKWFKDWTIKKWYNWVFNIDSFNLKKWKNFVLWEWCDIPETDGRNRDKRDILLSKSQITLVKSK